MKVTRIPEGEKLTLKIEGRLDTTTASILENELKDSIEGVKELILDVTDMEYISSAGLRVILTAQQIMNRQGSMVVKGANANVVDIFEVTGFIDIINVE